VAKGYLRTFTKGWASGSIFSVKAGTTVCGIRGSTVDVSYDPKTGLATFTSLDGKMFTFKAANKEEAVEKSVKYITDLAAGLSLGDAIQPMKPGDRRFSNGHYVKLTPQQVSTLRFASAVKAWSVWFGKQAQKKSWWSPWWKYHQWRFGNYSRWLNHQLFKELAGDRAFNSPTSRQ
jgi:hypothetical protein